MKYLLTKISSVNFRESDDIVGRYFDRLKSMTNIEKIILKSESKFKKKDHLIIFDPKGKKLSTNDLVSKIESLNSHGRFKTTQFVIGGPYGFSDNTKEQADEIYSFSDMVLAGDIAWIVLWEQFYRAHSIINGSKYHHE